MRNMLAFSAALVIALGALGFYLDWFNIHRTPGPQGNTSFRLDVNTNKIIEDTRKAEEKLQKSLTEKTKNESEKAEKNKPEQSTPKRVSSTKKSETSSEFPYMPFAAEEVDFVIDR